MTPLARRIGATLLLVLACALPAGSAQASPAGHHDNVAEATVETDATQVSDFAWDISKQRGGEVDHYNSARAAARCTDCGATAIAFQIVLAWGRPNPVVPRNEAVAINLECTRCVVAAEARQFVRVVDAPVKFTGEGRAELADVRRNLRALARENLPVADLHAAVEQEEAKVLDILQTQLVSKSDTEAEADVVKAQFRQDADLG
jgi:putative peptide zinc metalloprotease protein